jgi:hypothetical protein
LEHFGSGNTENASFEANTLGLRQKTLPALEKRAPIRATRASPS